MVSSAFFITPIEDGNTHRVSSSGPLLADEVNVKGGNRGGSVSLDDVTSFVVGAGARDVADHGRLRQTCLRLLSLERHILDPTYAVLKLRPSWTTIMLVRLACLGRWAERRL
jgi:hypothetical protein